MNQQEMSVELKGQLSPAEAELAGAFEEDALGLEDAMASAIYQALPPSAMQGSASLAAEDPATNK